MEELLKKLIEYGLGEREAALYLASLEIGESGMAPVAKKAGIKRSTAYLTFETLEARGLMGSFKMRDGLHFVATKPEIFFAREERRLKELSNLLPKFKELTSTKLGRPKIVYYEGKEGYRIAVEDSLKKPSETIRYIGSYDEVYKVVGADYDRDHYLPRRLKQRIFIKNLSFDDLNDKTKKQIDVETNGEQLRETRHLPSEYKFPSASMIYSNKVIIFAGSQEKVVVVIESVEIAHSEKQKFDLLWDLVGNK